MEVVDWKVGRNFPGGDMGVFAAQAARVTSGWANDLGYAIQSRNYAAKVEPDVPVGLMNKRMPNSPTRTSGSTVSDVICERFRFNASCSGRR
jgi:hypothetical protein